MSLSVSVDSFRLRPTIPESADKSDQNLYQAHYPCHKRYQLASVVDGIDFSYGIPVQSQFDSQDRVY